MHLKLHILHDHQKNSGEEILYLDEIPSYLFELYDDENLSTVMDSVQFNLLPGEQVVLFRHSYSAWRYDHLSGNRFVCDA